MKIAKILFCIVLCGLIVGCNSKPHSSASSDRSDDQALVQEETVMSESERKSQAIDEEVVADNKSHDRIVVIDFFATWCGPCKAMAPAIEEMKRKYGDKIDIKKIDVDEEQGLAQQYGITGVPTLVILSPEGEIIDKVVGAQPVEMLDKIFSELASQ